MQIIVCKLVHLLPVNGNKATKPRQCFNAKGGTTKMLQQAGRIMKLTAVIILAACLQVTAAGYGQKISLTERDTPIEKVLKKIQQQTSYRFLYTSQLLEGTPKVSLAVKDASIEEVLDLCFKGQKLDYEINENTIIIRPRREVVGSGTAQIKIEGPIDVRGVITDENGAPAQGVNIMVRGTSKGTSTNLKGEFELYGVDENAVLVITSVGYDRQEIPVKGKSLITMQLRVAVGNLDEMQVIAYGKTTKRFQTGNVSSVKASDIEKQPVNNPLLALQGRVPGLFITQNSGIPGGGVSVQVQGQNSIQSGNDPLYVIDGVPIVSQLPATGIDAILGTSGKIAVGSVSSAGSPLSYLNPSDIESIEVLKDADATAIYGSRAANGAILITTKKGKSGRTKFELDFQRGWGKVTRKIEMLNTREYLDMRYEALKNDNLDITSISDYDLVFWDTTQYTDWQKSLIGQTAKYININGSISGGTPIIQYLIGSTYHKETTVFPLPKEFGDQKGSVHFSLNNNPGSKFKFQFIGNYMVDINKLPVEDLTLKALVLEPNAPALYNSDGSINWAPNPTGTSTFNNPLVPMLRKYENRTNNLISNLILGYHVLPNLEFGSSFGYTNMQTNDFSSQPLVAVKPEYRATTQRVAVYGNRTLNSWVIEPQVNYKNKILKGDVEILIGGTLIQNKSNGGFLRGRGYNTDQVMKDIRSAATVDVRNSFGTQYKYNALFARIKYQWENKYVINMTARRDGSSRFGEKNLFHNFGSVGLAWIFTNEEIVAKNLKFLTFGKIRGSYGTTGNDQIADYSFLNLYNIPSNVQVPYQSTTGLYPSGLPNPHLKWEETKKLQFGIDLGLFQERVLMNFTYGRNRSSNQLLPYSLATTTGFSGILGNFPATVQNTSWEFSFNAMILKGRDLTWNTSANLTIPKNKLIAFPNIETSSYASGFDGVIVGQPLGVIKTYHFLGVNPSTGMYQVEDKNGSPTTTPDFLTDANTLINLLPKFYGGFQNTVTYKNIQLQFLFQFVKQKGINLFFSNGTIATPGNFFNGLSNQPVTVLDRWQKVGDDKSIQKYSANLFPAYDEVSIATASDAGYSDASYVRLKNISVSIEMPSKLKEKAHLQDCRLFIQGQNLITITNYQGLDPENQSNTLLPPLRLLTIGLHVGIQ